MKSESGEIRKIKTIVTAYSYSPDKNMVTGALGPNIRVDEVDGDRLP